MNFYIRYCLFVCRVMRVTLGWIPGMKSYIRFFENSYTKHSKGWTIYGIISFIAGAAVQACIYSSKKKAAVPTCPKCGQTQCATVVCQLLTFQEEAANA